MYLTIDKDCAMVQTVSQAHVDRLERNLHKTVCRQITLLKNIN